ncbi:hypothetical protein DBT_0001 [Dissulfuribacter thermophilus]|uniref:Uncharacterized protein n=1 Tax=Dissulfuribacter thermophilus TaxID=1156395 RepID=A0A1B9F8L1_9BACT|nr:hypothetical protein DBT_0001 [Dissulfuribacter thermophilus]
MKKNGWENFLIDLKQYLNDLKADARNAITWATRSEWQYKNFWR